MDRVFKSKVGWWYHMLMLIMAVLCVVSVLQQNALAIVSTIVGSAFVLYTFFNTYYVVTADGLLLVRCGFFPKKEIAITSIEALQASILPVFSYSLSLDRIIIWTDGKMWMLISPQREQEFVKLLKSFNSDIEIRKSGELI